MRIGADQVDGCAVEKTSMVFCLGRVAAQQAMTAQFDQIAGLGDSRLIGGGIQGVGLINTILAA